MIVKRYERCFWQENRSVSMERTRARQAKVNAISKRLPELDRLIMSAYEDKELGHVPESVCIQLLNQYEAERREKQDRRKELTEQLAASRENEKSADTWLNMMQDYALLEELDRPTLVRLIEKIVIGDRYIVDDPEARDIHIYYNFVGYIDIRSVQVVYALNMIEPPCTERYARWCERRYSTNG